MGKDKGNSKYRWLLWPIALLYGLAVSVRNKMYDIGLLPSKSFDTPVLCIGNLSMGGTGKTPHIEHLVKLLKNNHKIAVLSRGYKRKTRGFLETGQNSTIQEIGDEPKQIKAKHPDITVAVCADRTKGIEKLTTGENNANIVLLDDAFQHRRVKAGLNILLIDYHRPLKNDHMFPVGSLRDRPAEMARAHIVVITKTPKDIKPIERRILEKDLNLFPYQSLYFTTLEYNGLRKVFSDVAGTPEMPEMGEKQRTIIMVTGIAKPILMEQELEKYARKLVKIKYADHHNFRKKDINHILQTYNKQADPETLIVTTEKDAMRLQDSKYAGLLRNTPLYYLPVEIGFIYDNADKFNNQIINYVTKNKRKYHIPDK